MNRPLDPLEERLVAFLEGDLPDDERARLLDELERDPGLAQALRRAAAGLEAIHALADPEAEGSEEVVGGAASAALARGAASFGGPEARVAPPRAGRGRGMSPWWAVASAAATLVLSVPATLWMASGPLSEEASAGRDVPGPGTAVATPPTASDPSYVLVLQGRWPDAEAVTPDEARRRGREYWDWTRSLAEADLLIAAGDLRWEPGERIGPGGTPAAVPAAVVESPDFLVGMFALRVATYEEAVAVAMRSPHVRYGGSVSVRRVAAGFVTPGRGDWDARAPQGP